MPQCLLAVAPRTGLQSGLHDGKAKRLSAAGAKEYAISQGPRMMGHGQSRLRSALLRNVCSPPEPKREPTSDLAWDSDDGETFMLCAECRLPVGDVTYSNEKDGCLLHGECQAEVLLRGARREETARLKQDQALKKDRRAKYDLEWRIDRIPRNVTVANKLQCNPLSQGLCGLAWQEDAKKVSIVPTLDQSTSVNLEYLALALQVRIKEGREPMFSLDPKNVFPNETADKQELWQVKRFEPSWLAGTSVGEVMFQADYHLKELSMGEYAQPVMGMKSCFDLAQEEGLDHEWSAREWYVINKAEILITEDGCMIPNVKMGIEARETCQGAKGLEDVPITRHDHPLVKYAKSFTHNFDLIAERKSVVYHLREAAKATVLAKFLVENEAHLDNFWLSMASTEQPLSAKEIPQLWNEHNATEIEVIDGRIVRSETGIHSRMHGVYGGVELGLDRVRGAVPPPAGAVAARIPTLTARMISARGRVPEYIVGAPGVPKGVDLNLDKFSLSTAANAAGETLAGSWSGKDFAGTAFWSNMSSTMVSDEDTALLKDVFKPCLSDRREEGELFVPPSTSDEHVSILRSLVKEEAEVQQQRRNHFLSADFDMDAPGLLFPSSWTPSLGVARGQKRAPLHGLPDYKAEAARLLKTATPTFDKGTEDGTRFRVYRAGRIEVRTIQEHNAEEAAMAVFSSHTPTRSSATEDAAAGSDRIIKVTEYVEKPHHEAATGSRRFYVVLETHLGDMIVTERLADKTATWVENPVDLEYRNSCAKVIRSAECSTARVSVQDVKRYQGDIATCHGQALRSSSKHYAHELFLRVVPARLKAFAALAEYEWQAAEELGIGSEAAWDAAASEVWGLAWHELGDIRQEAARALGYSKALWPGSGCKLGGAWNKAWAELSQGERQAAKTLGFPDAGAWDGSSWEGVRKGTESVLDKSWVQLTKAEHAAAKALGTAGTQAWDEASWVPGSAWEEKWSELSEQERQAAKLLGINGPNMWDTAFGTAGRKGRHLAGIWEKSWGQLSAEQRQAAKRLGITGAGAWNNSQANSSAEKKWAQLTKKEQEEQMALWVKQHFGGNMEVDA